MSTDPPRHPDREDPDTVVDLQRSWFFFRTTGAFDHTPRMQLAASCRIEPAAGVAWTSYLTHPCIAESMYRDADLIQEPVAQFTGIVIDGQEVAFLRRTVADGQESRSTVALGAQMPTHSGIPATVRELRVQLATARGARLLRNGAAIRDAVLVGVRLAGRTRFERAGAWVTLDYPITTVNVSNDRDAWQVDAGPVLLPMRDPDGSGFAVDGLEPGYLVFDSHDWLEVTGLGGDGGARPVRLSGSSELFAID